MSLGTPSVNTLINSSNTVVYGNSSTGTALSVQQLGAGSVASFSNAAGSVGLFVAASSNVGINTTNPQFSLTSAGTICGPYSIPLLACYNQTSGYFTYANVISCSYINGRDSTQIFAPGNGSGGSTGNPIMTLQSGGLVGIGSTNPGYTLDVSGAARVTTLRSSVTTSYVITNNATQNYSIAGLAAGVYIVLINTAIGSGNVSGTGAGIYGFAYVFLGSTGTVTTVTQIVNSYCTITGSGSNITFQNGLNATYSGNVTLTCIAGNN